MQHTEKFIQKRRLLMVLPVLCFPFITLFFWALGGGQGIAAQAGTKTAGLNMELPDAYFNAQEKWDKLSIYERATKDSMERDDELTMEPYFELAALKESKEQDTVKRPKRKEQQLNTTPSSYSIPSTPSVKIDPMEEKVNKKLEQLYQQLNAPASPPASEVVNKSAAPATQDKSITSSEIEQLEKIMQSMNEPGTPDPEMEQIQSVLEKILDIQHPERVTEKLKQQSSLQDRKTYRVDGNKDDNAVSDMNARDTRSETDSLFYSVAPYTNGFYGLDDIEKNPDEDNAIPAVVHDTQEIVSGATIRLRLTQEVTLNDMVIPKDEYIYGTCTISGERLMITITSMRHENSIYPVALSAYGMDGLPGIHIPGAIARDAAKQSSGQALQGVQMMSMDPTLEMQAATLGLETAKGLFSKKTQLIKVTVKAEHPLLLKDTGLLH